MKRREIQRKLPDDRRVLGRRGVPRHAGEALLERHVRAARVLGRRAPRAGDPARRRGARRRRRGVPAALPRAHGGLRRDRAHGPLRLAQHAGDHPALRPRDPAWRTAGSSRTAAAPTSSPTTSRPRPAPASSRDMGRLDPRPATTSSGFSPSESSIATARRSTTSTSASPSGSRSLPRARAGTPVFPKIKLSRRRADRVQRDGRRPAWHEPSRPGEYVATAWIPGNLLNEGHDVGRRRRLLDPLAEAPPPRARPRGGLVPRPRPGEGDSARGLFTGQWRGVVRPLLEWTAEQR